jgi:hypothetical protein
MTGISTPLLERPLLLYFVVAAAVLRPWVIELVRGVPARVSRDRPGGHA